MFYVIKQKTAYKMRNSDWSSDVCSSDLFCHQASQRLALIVEIAPAHLLELSENRVRMHLAMVGQHDHMLAIRLDRIFACRIDNDRPVMRSEEHTSELQSLMRISYAVFCLKKKK